MQRQTYLPSQEVLEQKDEYNSYPKTPYIHWISTYLFDFNKSLHWKQMN